MKTLKGLKLSWVERWGVRALFLFVIGWIALLIFLGFFLGDGKVTVKAEDIRRTLNLELFSDAANIHLPHYVDRVKIFEKDSVTPSGNNFYRFRFRIKGEDGSRYWGEGTAEEKDMEYLNLSYSFD